MAELIQLHLNQKTDALARKSFNESDTFFYNQSYDLINLPSQFFKQGKLGLKQALVHELIFACLSIKALTLQDVVPTVQKQVVGDWQADETHPALPVLRNPNADNTFGDLISFMSISQDVHGVIYLKKIRNRTLGIVGLEPIQPLTVYERPKPGAQIFAQYSSHYALYRTEDIQYYQINEGGAARRVPASDVIRILTHDIRSPLSGYTAVQAALRAVGMDFDLDLYIAGYLKGGGPSGLLKIKNKTLSEEEAKDYQERWAKRYSLESRKSQTGQVAVFDEDADYQQIGSHLEGLASDVLKQHDQAAICSVLGVPGQLVQAYFAIRFGNQRGAQVSIQTQFWDNQLSPMLTRWRTQLDKYFLTDFDGRQAGLTSRIFWDTSSVKGLQEDIDKKATRLLAGMKEKAVTVNEYRNGLGLKPVPGGDFLPNPEEQHALAQEQAQQTHDLAMAQAANPDKPIDPNQKKSLEFKRQPTDLEKEQAAKIEKAQDASRDALLAVLLLLKAGLIQQGLEKLKALGSDFAQLALDISAAETDDIMAVLLDAHYAGASTVAVGHPKTGAKFERLKELAKIIVDSLAVGLAARLVSGYAFQALRGVDPVEILAKIESDSATESTAFYEQIASGGAFQAVADGRSNEAATRPYKRSMYSAILDKNTCENCLADDGKEAEKIEDLPPVPNPLCLGRYYCRCVHVLVYEEG